MPQRNSRIAASIREALPEIVRSRMNDPRLGFLTVTGVEVSPDLRHARIFVSVLGASGESTDRDETLAALAGARGFLRNELARKLALRRVPDLDFRLDLTSAQGDRIERLLRDLGPTAVPEDDPEDGEEPA